MKRVRAGVMVAGMLLAGGSLASETQLWITDSPADYTKAEAHGVVIGPDGVLSLGPRAVSSPVESLSVIWALAVLKDGSVAIGGERGRILRWTDSGGVRPWVRLPVGQVLTLAVDGDGVLAGTGPEGLVYRIGARGDTTRVSSTGERYVWALAPAGRGAWYAATGDHGKLLRIEGGRSKVVLDSDESNLVSLVADGAGGAFTGGDSRGRIMHVRADGSTRTVYDATEDEVRALALGADGALYAAALSASAVSLEGGEKEEEPQPARSAVSGGRATIYRVVPGSSAASWWSAPQPFVFALAPYRGQLARDGAGILAATGNRAGVYLLGPSNQAAQWLAAPEGQITALAMDARGRLFAASSNPGALWRLGPERADRGELLSAVLDARRYARFGRVRWHGGGGRVEVATRSGNSDPPDTTWSAWQSGAAREDGARSASPAGRYLQWKLTVSGGDPRVDAVEAAWREENVPPRLEDLVVAPQGVGFREGELQPRSEPVTQTLPGGQKVEYSFSTSSQRALRDLPAWARGMRTLQWKGSDPNGDALRYRVEVRSESDGPWHVLGEDLEAAAFTWDTNSLPDGRYRVRVTASDAPGNAVGEELTAEAVSEPFTVDNTPPAVTEFEARGEPGTAVLRGRAADQLSMLTRIEVSIDDRDWRVVTPDGGLADERELSFQARLPEVEPGEHTVAVRAVDRAGNTATRALRIKVPGSPKSR